MSCIFCQIVAADAPATITHTWPDAIAIAPRNPVTPGHLLVIPREHVADIAEDPLVSAAVMRRAAEVAGETVACNVITSKGSAATQTVFHLHAHVVPRHRDDGLTLPWTGQTSSP